MQKLFCFLTMIVGCSVSVYAQQYRVEETRPQGPALHRKIVTYIPEFKFGEEVSRDTTKIEYNFFNRQGQILYEQTLKTSKSQSEIYTDVVYEYANGRLAKKISRSLKVSDDLKILYETQSTISYIYNNSGKCVQMDCYNKEGKLEERSKFTYTANGYIRNMYNSDGEKSHTLVREGDKLEYTTSTGFNAKEFYDSNDRLIAQVYVGSGHHWGLAISRNYGYDKYGNLVYFSKHEGSSIKKKVPSLVYKQMPDGRIKATFENDYAKEAHSNEILYEYEYDSKGNWIKNTNSYDKEICAAITEYAKSSVDFDKVSQMIAQCQSDAEAALLNGEVAERLRVKMAEEAEKQRKEALKQARVARVEIEAARIDSLKKLRQEKLDIIKLCRQADKHLTTGENYEKNTLLCGVVRGYIEEKLGPWDYKETILVSAQHIELDFVSKTRLQYIVATQLVALKLLTEPELKSKLKEINKALKKAENFEARIEWWNTYMTTLNVVPPYSDKERAEKRDLINKCWSAFNQIKNIRDPRGTNKYSEFVYASTGYVREYLGLRFVSSANGWSDRKNGYQCVDDYDIAWLQNLLSKIEYVWNKGCKMNLDVDRLDSVFREMETYKVPSDEVYRIYDSYIRGDLDLRLYKWDGENSSWLKESKIVLEGGY